MSSQNRIYKIARVLPLALVLLAAGCGSREERAQGYYDRAMALLDQGDLPKARIEFRNALKIKEDMLPAWRGMAKLEEQAKNWPGVTAALRRVVELDPKDVESSVRVAQLLFAGGALDDAMKFATAATDADDKNTAAHALRAAILLRQGDGKSSVQEANKVLGLDPSNLDAMIVLAAEKLTRGDNKGALDTLDDIPKARQNELSVLFLRIRVYERLGDQANIEATLRKLVDTNPKEPAYKRELVRYLVTNKRIDDAEKIMRDLAAENPTDSKTGLELVSFLNMTKGPAAARAELRERIAKGGSNVFAYQIADADLDFALGKTDEATQALKTLISNLKEPSEILQARTHLAEMYLARKNVAAGEAVVNDILQTDGRSTDGLRLRATIRIDRGQLEEAIADLRQALNDQPKSPALLTLMGLAFERSGQIDLADKQYADAMRAANFSPQSGLTYVGFLKRRGILGHAENVLAELAQRNPNNPQILAALAQEKLEQKDWNAAQEIANALRKDNKAAAADQITAAALLGQNKLDEGLGALKSAYEANPNALQPMYALVRGYIQAKQVDKAEAFLDSILKANPSNAEALVLRGLTKLASNSPDLAVQNFKQAIEKQPKNPVGYGALADYYVQRGDNDTAIATLKDGLRQQPGAFALQLAYAGILEKKGEYDAAITEYEKMLKDQPGSLIVANNLASLLTDQRSDQASRERAMVVAAPLAKSQVPQFKDTLGWLYYQRGEYQNAVPLLEEAAASLPNNAWVKYHLGLTYAATGANEKATEQLQKALALEQNGDSSLKTKIQAALNK